MEILALIIAVVALILAFVAIQRTGGLGDIRRQIEALRGDIRQQVDALGPTTETMREKTADALDRLEQLVRGKERPSQGDPAKGGTQDESGKAGGQQ